MFRPFRGNHVSQEFKQLDFSRFGLGPVWVLAVRCTDEERKWTGDEYMVSILGWGEQPVIHWEELTDSERGLLLGEKE